MRGRLRPRSEYVRVRVRVYVYARTSSLAMSLRRDTVDRNAFGKHFTCSTGKKRENEFAPMSRVLFSVVVFTLRIISRIK